MEDPKTVVPINGESNNEGQPKWDYTTREGTMFIGALVVGLMVSIFQAVTQIQEQTLAIIPKMGAMIAVLAILFPWVLSQATTYMSGIFTNIPRYIGG